MAASTQAVSAVGQGIGGPDIFTEIGKKVKDAYAQASEARKEADAKIEELENIDPKKRTDEESEQLESLTSKRSDKGYFFKKALKFQATDKIKTTLGKFQRDPKTEYDPATSSKERFASAAGLLRPDEMPDTSEREGGNDLISYIGKGFLLINDAIDKIKAKVTKTSETTSKTSESASATETTTSSVSKSVDTLGKSTESISNTSAQEVKVQQMELDLTREAEEDRKQAEAEAKAEGQLNTSSTNDVIEAGQKIGSGKGFFGKLFNIGRNLYSRRFGRGGGRGKTYSRPQGRTQYTSPVGPQPMNSSTPWATKGSNERGGMYGQGMYSPRMESNLKLSQGGIISSYNPNVRVKNQTKLSDGGITEVINKYLPPPVGPILSMLINPMGGIANAIGGVGNFISGLFGGGKKSGGGGGGMSPFQMLTRPTQIGGEGSKAVIPFNRNVGQDILAGDGSTEGIGKLFSMFIPAGGAIAFGSLAAAISGVPFLSMMLKAAKPVLRPLIEGFGLPKSVLSLIFGKEQEADVSAQSSMEPTGPRPGDDDEEEAAIGGGDDDYIGNTPGGPNVASPGAPLTGGTEQFGSLSGTSGSVKYGGKEQSTIGTEYSPFSRSDIASKGITLTSGKGYRRETNSYHRGYDVGAPSGTPLYAYLPGTVTRIGINGQNDGGYGNFIEWKDSVYGEKHFFGHMLNPPAFNVGSKVTSGTQLGQVGGTGYGLATKYPDHLHWEIGSRGSEQDPGIWIKNHPLDGSGPGGNTSAAASAASNMQSSNNNTTVSSASNTTNTTNTSNISSSATTVSGVNSRNMQANNSAANNVVVAPVPAAPKKQKLRPSSPSTPSFPSYPDSPILYYDPWMVEST